MKSNVNIAFGKRVAELRKNAGYSQEQFAFKCDVDRTYIGTIERGEKAPHSILLIKLQVHWVSVKVNCLTIKL